MDKSWMQLQKFCPEYTNGIKRFIEIAKNHTDSGNRCRCPCTKCNNRFWKTIDHVNDDLLDFGMKKSYTRWEFHGEDLEVLGDDDDDEEEANGGEGSRFNGVDELIADIRAASREDSIPSDRNESNDEDREAVNDSNPITNERPDVFAKLLSEMKKPLYPGCQTFSKLEFLIKLFHLKIINRWSNKSFDMVLKLIKAVLPKGETLPKSHYECKTLMRDLGLGYITIHACRYDCALFWKDNEKLENCPVCNEPRYKILEGKGKKIPHKVLRYFPLIPRLQRLFMSRITSEDMRWHKLKRKSEENVLRHPADSEVWKEFDKEYEWFANDPRNVRLGIATDGFNPFGNMSNAYSMWPVMVIPYNLPPWKCMKEPFMFMSLLIPGPSAPGNDIDVYLRPLVDELKELWEYGIETYDNVTEQRFQLHAAKLWTINDFPAYGNLSGWSTKGKLARPNCNQDTCSMYLKNGRKLCYMGHRRFLPPRHAWRTRGKDLFDGKVESRLPPKDLSGDDLLSQLTDVRQQYGKNPKFKKRKRTESELNWTKKSIFFELPYHRSLKLPHNLDVMHIEKNFTENVLGTLMKLDGKTKDNVKTRLDLEAMGLRKELHLIPNGDKFKMPHACYSFTPTETKIFCEWLKSVKFPDGYASNISRCVNVKDGKISGMKSHDCHVLLQRLLPVALRGLLPDEVSGPLIELCLFFKELCCRTLKRDVLEKMENDIALILCKFETIFPPSFFDVMVHLAIHLPREAILGGPVQYRWMYPIERFLHTLKQYVRNKARPEGSIAEAYIDSECLTFCSMYLKGIETRFNREDRNDEGSQSYLGLDVFSNSVRMLGASVIVRLELEDYEKAHFYVLNNSDEVAPYIDQHKAELERQSLVDLDNRHKSEFANWFKDHMQVLRARNSPEATDALFSLASKPDIRVKQYNGCISKGIRYHTKERELRLRTQNSGLVVNGEHNSKDINFYGIITDIIQLNYIFSHQVVLFKCKWWDVGNKRTGIRTDRHFTSVNVARTWYEWQPFVLATQADQVFYVSDTKLHGDWQVVQQIQPRNEFDVLEVEEEYNGEAYQQEEQMAVNVILQHETMTEDVIPLQLNRMDAIDDEVDVDVVVNNTESGQRDDDAEINDDTEEDDTLMDYYSEQEQNNELSDDDSDID